MAAAWRSSSRRVLLLPRALHTHAAAHQRAAASNPRHLKFLVIDGYIQWGREDLKSGGAVTAGQLYADMLVRATPAPYTASYDLIFPADPGFTLPDLRQVRTRRWARKVSWWRKQTLHG